MDIRYNIELPLFSVSFLRQIPDSVVKLSEKQFLESQKDCASMLGMSLSEYEEYCKKIKVH